VATLWAVRSVFVVFFLLLGCAPAVPPDAPASRGKANGGWLENGVPVPEEGPGWVRARPGEGTRWGTPRLVEAVTGAATSVHETRPGGAPLRVADLSYRNGGRHPRHNSHRSGRDADLIFYATDLEGRSIRGRGWVAYDRFGVGREPEDFGGQTVLFDTERNWELVRSLVLDDTAKVQWLFVSRGLKARLLRYAIEHEPNREAIFRASWVLHQPRRGNPHADHFHVRVACGAHQRALGCRDYGPLWPWLRDDVEKPASAAPVDAIDDRALVDALLGPGGRSWIARR